MKTTYKSLDSLSSGISYIQAAIAKISGLLLMLGLIAATVNLLTKDWLFSSRPELQYGWAITQAIAVDANLWLAFVVLFIAIRERDWVKAGAYGVIGLLLLFVAAVITDIESVRQALEVSLSDAALRVHVSIEFLTQVRSVVVVLLVAMSGLDGLHLTRHVTQTLVPSEPVLVDSQDFVLEEPPVSQNGHDKSSKTRLDEVYALRPNATWQEAAAAAGVSESSVRRYLRAGRGAASANNGRVTSSV